MILLFLVMLISAMVIMPSGCLSPEEADPGTAEFEDIDDTPADEFIDPDDPTDLPGSDIDETPAQNASVIYATQGSSGSSRSSGSPGTSGPVNVEINVSSGSYTVTQTHVTGNLIITGETTGTITLPSTLTVDGDLSVDTPAATVYNYATVRGTINIIGTDVFTWNQNGNAGSINMMSGGRTLNVLGGTISNGINMNGNDSTLNLNGGNVPQVNLLKKSSVVINDSVDNLPDILVDEDADGSDIDNLANGTLNLELNANVTTGGNVNPSNESFVTHATSRGVLSVTPTIANSEHDAGIELVYTVGQDLVDGEIKITLGSLSSYVDDNYSINSAEYEIAGKVSEGTFTLSSLNISKNDQIKISFVDYELDSGNRYDFEATAQNTSETISSEAKASMKVLSDATSLENVVVNGENVDYNEISSAYICDVSFDVGSVDVAAILRYSSRASSMTIDGQSVMSGITKPVTLDAPGEDTIVLINVTSESELVTNTYDLIIRRGLEPVATPVANLSTGTYVGSQYVTLSTTTADASIHYTTNGDVPTDESTVYTEAILVNSGMTLKAIAVKDGMVNSEVATYEYTILIPSGVDSNRISQYNTFVSGVTLESTENGSATFSFGAEVDWPNDQDPNVELGANASLIYVDLLVERPNTDITGVLIRDEIVPLDNEINGTLPNGRLFYFPVAQVDGEEYIGYSEEETWELVIQWYIGDELEIAETLNVTREAYNPL